MAESSPSIPFVDWLKSVPGVFGIRLEEEPKYDVVEEEGDVQVRHYAPALLAEVTMPGSHDQALDQAFNVLANYIYGKNAPSEAGVPGPRGEYLAMTTPVLQSPEGNGWTVAFFLGNAMTAEDAPAPIDQRIRLRQAPAQTVAVVRYSGNNDDAERAAARAELDAFLARSPRWTRDGSVYWAQYDQPFAVPFLKRNEAQVAVTAQDERRP